MTTALDMSSVLLLLGYIVNVGRQHTVVMTDETKTTITQHLFLFIDSLQYDLNCLFIDSLQYDLNCLFIDSLQYDLNCLFVDNLPSRLV